LKKELEKYFEKRKDIAFAFLFGSQARELALPSSDVDIAVYFYPKRRKPLEFEEEVYYENEGRIWTDLERLLKREVELLVLNRAPSTVAASAIRGIPLIIKDWGLYLDFMEIITAQAEDFRNLLFRDFLERVEG